MMDVKTLKDKLTKSRAMWKAMSQASFLVDLYETLDNPNQEDIITWSPDGKVILIKDVSLIAERVLPYFESCHTIQQFLLGIEACKFLKVSGKPYGVHYAFKHKHFDSESRPIFECFDEKRNGLNTAFFETEANEFEPITTQKKLKSSETHGKMIKSDESCDTVEIMHSLCLRNFYHYYSLEMCYQSFCKELSLRRQIQQILNEE